MQQLSSSYDVGSYAYTCLSNIICPGTGGRGTWQARTHNKKTESRILQFIDWNGTFSKKGLQGEGENRLD